MGIKYDNREKIEWLNIWHEEANTNNIDRIALVGDSVTRGIRSELQKLYKEEDVAVDLFASSAQIDDPSLVNQLLFFLNDSDYKYQTVVVHFGGQHGHRNSVTVNSYADIFDQNMAKIYYLIYKYCKNIYFLSYTPCVRKEDLNELDEHRNKEIMARNAIMRSIADKMGCRYINIYDELLLLHKYKHTDNIHFDRESNVKIANMIKEEICSD